LLPRPKREWTVEGGGGLTMCWSLKDSRPFSLVNEIAWSADIVRDQITSRYQE